MVTEDYDYGGSVGPAQQSYTAEQKSGTGLGSRGWNHGKENKRMVLAAQAAELDGGNGGVLARRGLAAGRGGGCARGMPIFGPVVVCPPPLAELECSGGPVEPVRYPQGTVQASWRCAIAPRSSSGFWPARLCGAAQAPM